MSNMKAGNPSLANTSPFGASSTRQFISPLDDAVEVGEGCHAWMLVAVPGCVSAAAAAHSVNPRGPVFSKKMIGLAQRMEEEEERKQRAAAWDFHSW
jgi:hypothetical protein